MIQVKDIMSTDLMTLTPNQEINEAVDALVQSQVSGLPVVDEENDHRLVGMLSEKDCFSLFTGGPNSKNFNHVHDYMTEKVMTVLENASIMEAIGLFLHSHYRRLPVIDGYGKLVGLITRKDVLKAAHFECRECADLPNTKECVQAMKDKVNFEYLLASVVNA